MASFTKKVFGLAGAAITFAGMAFGQATCAADPSTAANIIRAEGTTEQIGQMVIRCSTTATTTSTAGIGALQVFVSLPVTSKVFSATGTSEAVAVVSGSATQVQGTVSGTNINFGGLAFPALGNSSSFTITVSNVRVNATSASVSTTTPTIVTESGFISGSPASISPAIIASQQLSFIQNGLGATGIFTAVGGATTGVTANFVNCVAQTQGLSGVYRLNEGFNAAFKIAGEEQNQVLVPGQVAPISTRIKVTISNVPVGATVQLPLTVATSTLNSNAALTWVTSETGTTAATADTGLVGLRSVTLTSGSGSVFYSVTASDSNSLDRFDIPVRVTTTNNSVTATSPAITITSSLAPIASATAIPTFSVTASSTTLNLSSFSQCSTSLLFPFVTNQIGFDTGIAISNTSSDPFGTRGAANQSGTCTLSFYGIGAPSPSSVVIPTTTAGNIVASGSTATAVLSSLASGFQGYAIAQCNFQYAHGFAFITNGVGVNGGLSQGYLAGVIPDVNQKVRNADPLSTAAAGTGETLGN